MKAGGDVNGDNVHGSSAKTCGIGRGQTRGNGCYVLEPGPPDPPRHSYSYQATNLAEDKQN